MLTAFTRLPKGTPAPALQVSKRRKSLEDMESPSTLKVQPKEMPPILPVGLVDCTMEEIITASADGSEGRFTVRLHDNHKVVELEFVRQSDSSKTTELYHFVESVAWLSACPKAPGFCMHRSDSSVPGPKKLVIYIADHITAMQASSWIFAVAVVVH